MNQKEQIRRAHSIEGKSIRQIQRETGSHRQTIRKALGDGTVPSYTLQQPRTSPVLDPVKPIIEQWLAEDEGRPPKQRHTPKRIYDRLTTEYQFTGAESPVRRSLGHLRRQARAQVFIPLTYAPGQVAQVDFGEAQVGIAGRPLTASFFCLRLGYSNATLCDGVAQPGPGGLLRGPRACLRLPGRRAPPAGV
ncbi:MAG: hypothetical protein M5U01_09845 [Ardenticatenaceae bacterium]|nr:hypothetical protein [Ardenticatenaceae bacterium]